MNNKKYEGGIWTFEKIYKYCCKRKCIHRKKILISWFVSKICTLFNTRTYFYLKLIYNSQFICIRILNHLSELRENKTRGVNIKSLKTIRLINTYISFCCLLNFSRSFHIKVLTSEWNNFILNSIKMMTHIVYYRFIRFTYSWLQFHNNNFTLSKVLASHLFS